MTRTTIEIPSELRDKLKVERKPHESNYGDTIERLLNDGSGGKLWTEKEIKGIAERQAREVVEALQR